MGMFSSNVKYVNRRAKKRLQEARGIIAETELTAAQSRDASLAAIGRLTDQKMSQTLSSSFESRNEMRDSERRAMDQVSRFSGGNRLAMLRARAQAPTSADIKAIYGQAAGQRVGIQQQRMADELGVENQYLQQLINARTADAQMLASFQEQVDPGMGGALLNAASTFAGFAAFSCWVAREVYGATNPRWLAFREWLFDDAPDWFFKLYMTHGKRFAKFISNKPWLKSLIRRWMDKKIEGRKVTEVTL